VPTAGPHPHCYMWLAPAGQECHKLRGNMHKNTHRAPTALWLYDTVCGVDCEAGKDACPTKCCRVAAVALPCGLPPCDPARSSCLAACGGFASSNNSVCLCPRGFLFLNRKSMRTHAVEQ